MRTLRSRIGQLGRAGSALARENARELQDKADQLATLVALQQANAVVVREAQGAVQIGPTPPARACSGSRSASCSGSGSPCFSRLTDTRLRSAEQIGATLDLPLLARLPDPGRRLRRGDKLVMLEAPNDVSAEAFRIMRTDLEFTSPGSRCAGDHDHERTQGRGQVDHRRESRRRARARRKPRRARDLDLRCPGVARFFGHRSQAPGLTNVVLGHTPLDETLVPAAARVEAELPRRGRPTHRLAEWQPAPDLPGRRGGLLPQAASAQPGEFVGSGAVQSVIRALRERADFVIVDVPPALHVGDAMTIAGFVDAVVLVVNPDVARRPVVDEFAHVISRSPAERLGFVVCGGAAAGPYQYYGYSRPESARHEQTEHELIR